MIITVLLPFSFVSNVKITPFVNVDPVSYNTCLKYMQKLTFAVEEKIRHHLPSKFSVIFDRWSSGSTHYTAIYN